MKLLITILFLSACAASAQTPFPSYVPSNPDSVILIGTVNGAPRSIRSIDLVKYRAALAAHDTANALRLLIADNANAINGKVDKTGTISINGSTQNFGSNPSFTISAGGSGLAATVKVTDFGAKGDGKYFTGAAISSGSANATISGGTFTSADVGKYISIGGAGAAGARLSSTISSVQSATTITLANAASTTVSGQSGKYGTDNTDAFQDAIYSLRVNGIINGKIIVPYTGYPYFFTKAPTYLSRDGDSVNNAQLYIPSVGGWGANVKNMGSLEIEGEIEPNFYADYLARSTDIPQKMVILQSTIDTAALFGNAFTNIGDVGCGGTTNINFTQFRIKNIAGRVNSKNGTSHIQAKTTAFDFSNMGMLEIVNVMADVESPSYAQAQPDTVLQYGIKTMSTCNWAHQVLENVYVRGFGNGASLSEHAEIRNIFIAACYNGLVVQPMIHGAHVTKALIQWTRNNIKVIGTSHFNISYLDAENSGTGTNQTWQRNLLDLFEPTNTNSTGAIVYHTVANSGASTTFRNSATMSSGIIVNKLGDLGPFSRLTSGFAADLSGTSASNYYLRIKNAQTTGQYAAGIQLENSANNSQIFKPLTSYSTYKNIKANDLAFYNATAGDISMLNDRSGGKISLYTSGGTGIDVASTGNLLVGTSTDNSKLTVAGSVAFGYTFKSADYTATASDYTIDCVSSSMTITLPTAVGIAGRIYVIKNRGSGTTVTVATTSSQTIDGATTYSLAAQYKYVTVQSNGSNWMVIGNN